MKILFLCGSLEVGKDGVGDYVRRLAGELIRQGYPCCIMAIMDKFMVIKTEETQVSVHTAIEVLRLPFKVGFKANTEDAKKWVLLFNPDWISLQFVPFSFHDKGLPLGFGKTIKEMIAGRQLHIMFHELWVGMDTKASIKLRILGYCQRLIIKTILNKLKPAVIHTNTALYCAQLSSMGVRAAVLPLFGNIPVLSHVERDAEGILPAHDTNKLSLIVFGSIHFGAPVTEFARQVRKFTVSKRMDVEIIFIGRCGQEQQHWVSICLAEGLVVKVLGEQSISKISETLRLADFGISSTPILLSEKSGTVAAMHEHGLPVLCVARPWVVKGFSDDYTPLGVQMFKNEDLSFFLSTKNNTAKINQIETIANQFINSLMQFN